MKQLVFEFSQNDLELMDAITAEFPPEELILKKHRGLGEELELVLAIVAITDFTLHCYEFIKTYFVDSRKSTESEKRVIVTPEGKLSLRNYSSEEVVQIIKGVLDDQDDF